MRTAAVSAFLLIPLALLAGGSATAGELPAGTPSANAMMRRMRQLTVDIMPLVSPNGVRAVAAAKKTLIAAQKKVAKAAEGVPDSTMGFLRTTLEIGAPGFANENALYMISSGGHRRHIGYAMEMRVDPRSNETRVNWSTITPVVPIAISRAGRVLMPLFRGEKAVFVMGHTGLPREMLNRIGDRDLKAKSPLDYQAQVLARAQRSMSR